MVENGIQSFSATTMHLSTTVDTLRIMILAIDDACAFFIPGNLPATYCILLVLFCKGRKIFSPLKHLPCPNKSLIIVEAKRDGFAVSFLCLWDLSVLFFKVADALFDHLLQLPVLCAPLIFRDIAQLVQQYLLYPQRVSAEIILHFAASMTKY